LNSYNNDYTYLIVGLFWLVTRSAESFKK